MEKYSKEVFRINKKGGIFTNFVAQLDISHLNKKGRDSYYERLSEDYPLADHDIIEVKSDQELRLFRD